jgi:hypothetical protein
VCCKIRHPLSPYENIFSQCEKTVVIESKKDYDKIMLEDSTYQSANNLMVFKSDYIKKYYHIGMLCIQFGGKSLTISHLKKAEGSLVNFIFGVLDNVKEDTSIIFRKLQVFQGTKANCIPKCLKESPNLKQLVIFELHLKNEEQISNIPPSVEYLKIGGLKLPKRIKILSEYLFRLPNLKSLVIYSYSGGKDRLFSLSNIKIDSSNIEKMALPIDISEGDNIKFLSQFKHLKGLEVTHCKNIDSIDLSPLSFVKEIYIINITDKEKEVLKKKFKNVF